MLRKPIKYTNIDGQEVTEEFYFHLSKADVIRLQVNMPGGLAERLDQIGKLDVNEGNNAALILQTFEDIVHAAFGRRTPSGGFVKRASDWEEFVSSDAYSELFMELISNGAYAAQFVKSILPADMDLSNVGGATEALTDATQDVQLPEGPVEVSTEDARPAWLIEERDPTTAEIRSMSRDELMLAMQIKNGTRSGG